MKSVKKKKRGRPKSSRPKSKEDFFIEYLTSDFMQRVEKYISLKGFSNGIEWGLRLSAQDIVPQFIKANQLGFNIDKFIKSRMKILEGLKDINLSKHRQIAPESDETKEVIKSMIDGNEQLLKYRLPLTHVKHARKGKGKFKREEIVRFIRMVKECDGLPTLSVISKKLHVPKDSVLALYEEAKRLRMPIEIEKGYFLTK